MTEQEKQYTLTLFKEVLRQMEPQLDIAGLEKVHEQMMTGISSNQIARSFMLPLAIQLADVIEAQKAKRQPTLDAINYIQNTPADQITHESIKEAMGQKPE